MPLVLQSDDAGKVGLDGFGNLFHHLRRHVLIEEQHDDGVAPLGATTYVHGRDVDVAAAQNGADLADHARPILVGQDQDVALGDELDVQVTQAHDARHPVEDRARDDLSPGARVGGHGDQVGVAGGGGLVGGNDHL